MGRHFLISLRALIAAIIKDIYDRAVNVAVEIQKSSIKNRDSTAKAHAATTSGLFTLLGGYLSLQSFVGSLIEILIIIMVTMAAMIAILWVIPLSWPYALAWTAYFVAMLIPLALVTLFMEKILGIPAVNLPHVPKCFDKNTLIRMRKNNYKPISEIRPGNKLWMGDYVLSVFKLDASGVKMFRLNDTIVSGTHKVNYGKTWICASDHPDAKAIPKHEYTEPYIY